MAREGKTLGCLLEHAFGHGHQAVTRTRVHDLAREVIGPMGIQGRPGGGVAHQARDEDERGHEVSNKQPAILASGALPNGRIALSSPSYRQADGAD
jgi:hypothetical protein